MSKKMSSKLADSLRQARDGRPPAMPPAPPKRPNEAVPPPAHPHAPRRSAGGYARQNDQTPPPSLDRTWDNLHPERIWPD